MWLIKTESKLFNSIRRYLIYNKSVDSKNIVNENVKECKAVIFQYDNDTLSFLDYISSLPTNFEINTFLIIGEKSNIDIKLKLFLKDNKEVRSIDYLELIDELKEI